MRNQHDQRSPSLHATDVFTCILSTLCVWNWHWHMHPSLFQSMILALRNCFRWKQKFNFGFEYFSLFKSFKIKSAVQNIWSIVFLETFYLYFFFLNINLNANIRSVKLNYYSNYPNTMILFGYSLNIVVNEYGIHSAPYSTCTMELSSETMFPHSVCIEERLQ